MDYISHREHCNIILYKLLTRFSASAYDILESVTYDPTYSTVIVTLCSDISDSKVEQVRDFLKDDQVFLRIGTKEDYCTAL